LLLSNHPSKSIITFGNWYYLIDLRVNRAKELLLTGSFSVNQVAAEVGFADQSHLHCHFKRIFGITPKAVLRG
jgi:AraC family transcriptional regulator